MISCNCGYCEICVGVNLPVEQRPSPIVFRPELARFDDDRETRCSSGRNSPNLSTSIIEEIERRAFNNMIIQRQEDEERQKQREAERQLQRERQQKILAETQAVIQRNREIISSSANTLSKIEKTLEETKKTEEKYLEFKQKFDEILRNALERAFNVENKEELQKKLGVPREGSLEEASRLVEESNSLVFLTGAGISEESGVPTYKASKEYIMNGRPVSHEEMATLDFLKEHPFEFWERQYHTLKKIRDGAPNPSHLAISQMHSIFASQNKSLSVITQNIDGYHMDTLPTESVLELHGTVHESRCSENCCPTIFNPPSTSPLMIEPYLCPFCESLARPNVLLFNEPYPSELAERAREIMKAADLLIVVGTELKISAPEILVKEFAYTGKPIIEINTEPVIEFGKVLKFTTSSTSVLPELVGLIS